MEHKIGDLVASTTDDGETPDYVIGWIDHIDLENKIFAYSICWLDGNYDGAVYTADHIETYKLLFR